MLSKLNQKISYFIMCIAVAFFSLICILPFWLVVIGSMTSEAEIINEGYKLIPKLFDFVAYKVLFIESSILINGYKISIIVTVAGTVFSVIIVTMMAYSISRKSLKYRNMISIYAMITLLFNGGVVPWFILCRNYLHLRDSYAALIVPYLVNAWNVFLTRNYFLSIPDEMYESAKIDGASELTIFARIILPLSKPIIATIALFISLGYWNDWWLGIMLIDKSNMQPLQLLLRTIVSNIQFLQTDPNAGKVSDLIKYLPTEGLKMATCVVTVGPIIIVYPFVQKYFVKGIMLGAIKS